MKAYRIHFFFFLFICLFSEVCTAQIVNDSTTTTTDSLQTSGISEPANKPGKLHTPTLDSFLKKNKYINTQMPISLDTKERSVNGKEFLFYLSGIAILLLALFKVFYSRYFNNIFKVFFNTSLRQNQLTDLLLQAKLPSLIFNIFFVISTGLYTWLLLVHYGLLKQTNDYIIIALSILFIGVIYSGKFLSLKFIGWISGMRAATDQYIFVIFLINKIIGIILIPFIILVAFAPAAWLTSIIILSFLVTGVLFLLRYLRSYALLQFQLRINRFHFLLYIIGIELLPILIIYKLVIKSTVYF